jgi:hypothetical protein
MKIEEQVKDLLSVFMLENAITYCHSKIAYHHNHGTKEGLIHWTKVKLRLEELKKEAYEKTDGS